MTNPEFFFSPEQGRLVVPPIVAHATKTAAPFFSGPLELIHPPVDHLPSVVTTVHGPCPRRGVESHGSTHARPHISGLRNRWCSHRGHGGHFFGETRFSTKLRDPLVSLEYYNGLHRIFAFGTDGLSLKVRSRGARRSGQLNRYQSPHVASGLATATPVAWPKTTRPPDRIRSP